MVGTGVLHFHRDVAAVVPHRLVYLADGRRGRRFVGEFLESVTPLGAQLVVEHAVHLGCGQWWGFCLELGESVTEGFAELLGDRRLHDRQRLAYLHGAALQLAQDGEQLLGGLLEHVCGNFITVPTCQPSAEPRRRPSCHPERKRGELGIAPRSTSCDLSH